MRPRLTIAIGMSILCLCVTNVERTRAGQGYEHFVVGNANDVTRDARAQRSARRRQRPG